MFKNNLLKLIFRTLQELFGAFVKQKIPLAFILAFVIFILSLLFAFLAYSPVLSPFIYPLF
jgi:hypothetical protein